MNKTAGDVLGMMEKNAIREATAKIKKEFAVDREKRMSEIQTVLIALMPLFGDDATHRSIYAAQMTALRARIEFTKQASGQGVLALTLIGGLSVLIEGLSGYVESEMTEKIMMESVEKKFMESTKKLFDRGVTLGDIFESQPELFV